VILNFSVVGWVDSILKIDENGLLFISGAVKIVLSSIRKINMLAPLLVNRGRGK